MNHSIKKTISLVSLGSALEYYDFVIYGMMTQYLSQIFFPPSEKLTPVLYTLSTFALGYIARPLGGTIAGIIADMYGRQRVFLFLTAMMAVSTMIIGCLPHYSTAGVSVTFMLIACRIVQGLSFGGELAGATTMVGELSCEKTRSLKTSFVLSSASIGAITATFTLYLLHTFLDGHSLIAWGWRIPFLSGGIFGIILWILRKNIIETPLFTQSQREKNSSPSSPLPHRTTLLLQEMKKYRREIPLGMMLTLFFSSLILVNLYFPFFINYCFSIETDVIYRSITISLVFSCFMIPVMGWVADYVNRTSMLITICIAYILFNIPLFSLFSLSAQSSYLLISYMMIHQLFIAAYSSCYFPLLFTLFSTKVRYTGVAFCYNSVYALMGFLPWLLTLLLKSYKDPLILPLTMTAICIFSLISLILIRRSSPST